MSAAYLDGGYQEEEMIPGHSPAALIIFVACLVSVVTVVGLQAISKSSSTTEGVQVPELVGVQLAQAKQLALASQLEVQLMGETIDTQVPKGAVARQSPLAGSIAAPGSPIVVTLSSGPQPAQASQAPPAPAQMAAPAPTAAPTAGPSATPLAEAKPAPPRRGGRRASGMVPVPKVTGMRLPFSRRRIEARGLVVGRVSYTRDEDHMETFVLGQSPQPGTEVPRGSPVDVVVNRVE